MKYVYHVLRYIITGDEKSYDYLIGIGAVTYEQYKNGENTMARIVKNTDGTGELYVNGQLVKTYARARDARRGAARLGYAVA